MYYKPVEDMESWDLNSTTSRKYCVKNASYHSSRLAMYFKDVEQ